MTLSFSLERMREWLGPDYPLVRMLMTQGIARRLGDAAHRGNRR